MPVRWEFTDETSNSLEQSRDSGIMVSALFSHAHVQGGKPEELHGISDPVFRGKYFDYIVPGIFAHTFRYNKFDNKNVLVMTAFPTVMPT